MQNACPFLRSGLLPQSVVGILFIAVLLAGVCSSSVAHAAGGQPSFGLQPVLYDPTQPDTRSYFVFDARPGTILHNRIRVTNSGAATGTASLYAVDATTGQTSGTVYLSHHDAQRDVGAWITLGMQHVTLAPGQSQLVPFQVAIPGTIWPGQHVGGIVAESMTLGSPPRNSTLQVHVQNLTIIAVQVNLPGPPVEQLVATGIHPGGANNDQTLLVGLRNTGTMMLKPSGNLQVTNAQEQLLQNLPIKLDTFLPQTAITYPVYVKGHALGVGDYRATLILMYGHGQLLRYTTAFTITEQQVTQVFKPSTSLQAPGVVNGFFGTLPLWQIVLAGLLLSSGMFFWGQKLYLVARGSRRRDRKHM